MSHVLSEFNETGTITEIKEKSNRHNFDYNSDFIRFVMKTSDEEIIVKFEGSNSKLKQKTRVAVTGVLQAKDYYNKDDRKVIRASKIEIINPQKKLDVFIGVKK